MLARYIDELFSSESRKADERTSAVVTLPVMNSSDSTGYNLALESDTYFPTQPASITALGVCCAVFANTPASFPSGLLGNGRGDIDDGRGAAVFQAVNGI